MRFIKLSLCWGLYPIAFGSAVGALVTFVAMGRPYWLVAPVILVGVAAVVTWLERVRPFAVAWQTDAGDRRTDIAHLVGNLAVSHVSIAAYALGSEATGGSTAVWPADLPPWVQFLIATLIVDLGLYVIHRASHVVPWLWRLHAIHHSSRRVYWVNGQRRHLLHEVIEGAPGLVVLLALGAPPPIVACAIATVTLHLMFQHANVDYRVGPLRYVFAVAELHRWHHQRRYRDVQGNYGAIFSMWDHLFGTALTKHGDAPLDVGMDDEPDLPNDWKGQMAWPFRAHRRTRQ